jgi:nicotinate phosphoribosyltransferase
VAARSPATPPEGGFEDSLARHTDHYFKRTRKIVVRSGEVRVAYAVFMRRPVIFCPRLAVAWLEKAGSERGVAFDIELCFAEGAWVGAGEPLMYINGPLSQLVDLETIYLQKLGPPCVAAYNAFAMCADLPKVAFLAMDARHCAGAEMAEMMAYAASVGSRKAQAEAGAVGFIGNANDATAHYFGNERGLGTMPHALLGYAGSTLRAAEMFHDVYADEPVSVLVDYYGREVTDSIAVAERFPELAAEGRLWVRIDTHGGRFVEGLDTARSYDVLERHAPQAVRTYRNETELRWLVGTGVTAAAIFHLRDSLDRAGFGKVQIVASSGFNPSKCKVFASVDAPVNMIGTGSYLPEKWSETYATADIVEYDGRPSVKVGREFLLRHRR